MCIFCVKGLHRKNDEKKLDIKKNFHERSFLPEKILKIESLGVLRNNFKKQVTKIKKILGNIVFTYIHSEDCINWCWCARE